MWQSIHFHSAYRSIRGNRQDCSQTYTNTRIHWNRTMNEVKQRRHSYSEWLQVEDRRSMDSVAITLFNINSLISVIVTKWEIGSKYARCQVVYKVDTSSDGNLLLVDLFRRLFLQIQQKISLAKKLGKHAVLQIYNELRITQLGACKVQNNMKG